ncbi:hypothetical protein ISF_01722 [Cordyceps fumosorosea ARSEF 2679]|uniref:Uncharacterized protein n=1 Tax=Cordyceps fumosorosea (strain ARSEF 2679) TaxID=1081104 RepID=A0A168CB04_CORFA|nr:hypothetical protein ISF_01722 [Cordyceps fumosorosea ARSEF 2679]OAA71171.1 hypothetical protein ISF_01722 [Cordyceps fumosorosea ARSEF 2679]
MSDKRSEALLKMIANLSYDWDRPFPFWYFTGKMVSKARFDDQDQLKLFNATRVMTEYIAFENTAISDQDKSKHTGRAVQVVEIYFSKPQPGKNFKLTWKPARSVISRSVQRPSRLTALMEGVPWASPSSLFEALDVDPCQIPHETHQQVLALAAAWVLLHFLVVYASTERCTNTLLPSTRAALLLSVPPLLIPHEYYALGNNWGIAGLILCMVYGRLCQWAVTLGAQAEFSNEYVSSASTRPLANIDV